MKIESTSNMVNVLKESARNHNIVLQWRINKIASWMSLKSSEINNCSCIISTVLESPSCSSSCCQTCFPSTIRPMNRLWEWILKIFFDSPDMNRSILFSMYCLRVSKKMDYFLRHFVLREKRIFPWFNVNPLPFIHRNDTRWITSRFPSLWFCFCLCLAHKIFCTQFKTHILRPDLREFLCRYCSKTIANLFDPCEILTHESVLSLLRDNSGLNSTSTVQATNWL